MKIIKYIVCLAIVFALTTPSQLMAEKKKTINIGVQLYSVRDDLKKDFAGTLKKLSAIGFKGVEFAGIYGEYEEKPEALNKLLNKLNLKVAGAHFRIEKLRGEMLKKNIDFAKTIGCEYLIVSWDDRVLDKIGIAELSTELNQLAKILEPHGLKIGYHNHDDEMREVNGVIAWDTLASLTNQNVILQQDVGWTTYAGKDPIYYVKKYPGRTLSTHYKAKLPIGVEDKLPIIGQDTIKWPLLIETNVKLGGTQWFTIEQEDYPEDLTPMQSVEASFKGLTKILSELGYGY